MSKQIRADCPQCGRKNVPFYKSATRSSGHSHVCKECSLLNRKTYPSYQGRQCAKLPRPESYRPYRRLNDEKKLSKDIWQELGLAFTDKLQED